MNCTDCIARLHDYVDAALPATDAHAFETHVANCARCRAELESLRTLLANVATLPAEIAPARDLWRDLHPKLAEVGTASGFENTETHRRPTTAPVRSRVGPRAGIFQWLAPLGVAAAAALLVTFGERTIISRPRGDAWSVATISGAPRVDATTVRREAEFRVGQWLETDADSRAKVAVGNIGEVTVDPNSRLRLVGMAATDHRLELARGTMRALIWAPPRLFFVNTASATAVDLGCQYTLTVDDHGDGELHVLTGHVALEHGKRESIIPMGMMCLTRRDSGPGTPFAVGASPELRAALTRFDFEPGAGATALPDIIAHVRAEDAITLWHLLARTDAAQCGLVFDTLAKFSPPPAGVTRAGILARDFAMLRAWGTQLGLSAR